jgi:hypothetical protein
VGKVKERGLLNDERAFYIQITYVRVLISLVVNRCKTSTILMVL